MFRFGGLASIQAQLGPEYNLLLVTSSLHLQLGQNPSQMAEDRRGAFEQKIFDFIQSIMSQKIDAATHPQDQDAMRNIEQMCIQTMASISNCRLRHHVPEKVLRGLQNEIASKLVQPCSQDFISLVSEKFEKIFSTPLKVTFSPWFVLIYQKIEMFSSFLILCILYSSPRARRHRQEARPTHSTAIAVLDVQLCQRGTDQFLQAT